MRPLGLVALFAVLLVAFFQGCGGRIAQLPMDAGVDSYVAAPPVDANDDTFDAGNEAEADVSLDAYEAGIDAWDGYYDPYVMPPDPYDAAAYPPCLGITPDADMGAPSSVYPAFTPEMPTIHAVGGPTLTAPAIVPITWAGDPLQAQINQFVGNLGASSYWQSFAPAYGIQPPTSTPAQITDAYPPYYTDGQIEDMLTQKLMASPPQLPAPTAGSLYVFFLPDNVLVRPQSGGHNGNFGCDPYHAMTIIPGRPTVPFVVIPRCNDGSSSFNGIDLVSMRATDAMVGAIENPNPLSLGLEVDADHYMWAYLFGTDPTGLCSPTQNPQDGVPLFPADFPFWVQRQWSNTASSAIHQPCQPGAAADGPFFAAVPIAKAPVFVNLDPPNSDNVSTLGVDIPLNMCRVIEVDLTSDAPLGTPMTVGAFESGDLYTPCTGSMCARPKLVLQFQWDRQQGYNGEKLHLTVAKNGESPSGYDAFYIQASYNGKVRRWPVVLGDGFPP
jgi:hypothetical protein